MNTRPLEVAMQVAELLKPLAEDERYSVLLMMGELAKVKAQAEGEEDEQKAPAPRKEHGGKMLSVREAAQRRGVSEPTVYAMLKSGTLTGYKTAQGVRIRLSDLNALRPPRKDSGGAKPSPTGRPKAKAQRGELLSYRQAAERRGCTVQAISDLCYNGRLPKVKTAEGTRVWSGDVDQLPPPSKLSGRKRAAAQESPKPAPDDADAIPYEEAAKRHGRNYNTIRMLVKRHPELQRGRGRVSAALLDAFYNPPAPEQQVLNGVHAEA